MDFGHLSSLRNAIIYPMPPVEDLKHILIVVENARDVAPRVRSLRSLLPFSVDGYSVPSGQSSEDFFGTPSYRVEQSTNPSCSPESI